MSLTERRVAGLETVSYKTAEMKAATDEFIVNYARYSGVEGIQEWPRVLISLRKIIDGHLPFAFQWETPAIKLTFSGFPLPHPHIANKELNYETQPPHFVLEEGVDYELLNARTRSRIERNTRQIVDAVSETHRLNVEWRNPELVMEFPKDQYAQNIQFSNATIL